MSVLAVAAILLGAVPILAFIWYLIHEDAEAFFEALGLAVVFAASVAAICWGIAYLVAS
ncbi:common antigen polymerase [Mycolicibacterium canariasense]|uniref:Common antigen polymerase n=1 Tax=Mycolicibacterium canariasense TaxID=228230 RepID=A0A100WCB6_MYCCR|nr:hypothetical protein [Mycolicibacterium canariasense]MCV7212624.1 hypothetical protein [Mycolicibacterium canariasense]GAS95515.1 common antigen polymerase [Mycolicibacterium canariasense]